MTPQIQKIIELAEKGEEHFESEETQPIEDTSGLIVDESSERKSKVQFRGVEIREYARSLGDNPSARGGCPLGLDWDYYIVKRSSFPGTRSSDNATTQSSDNDTQEGDSEDSTVIPLDEFEHMAIEKRRKRLLNIMKLREKAEKQMRTNSSRKHQRQASTGHFFFRDGTKLDPAKKDELTEEQINQLSASWLKIQPVPGNVREKILLEHTNCSKNEIAAANRQLAKLRHQRQSSTALADTAVHDIQAVLEFCTRRIRRLRKGVSKEREQELLWEMAADYWRNIEIKNDSKDLKENGNPIQEHSPATTPVRNE